MNIEDDNEDEDGIGDLRQQFHNTVRENVIFFIFFLTLSVISWTVVAAFLRKKDKDGNIPAEEDADESTVYRICFWMSIFSLSISMGATLLLPISIVSNEVLLLYPNTYYVKWLNGRLIQGLWSLIFLFANISLFILLPLAYLLIESEGFSGHKKGVAAKFYEALVVLVLVTFAIWGIAYILGAILDSERFGIFNFGFSNQLPFVYSCISFLGVLLLLVCTPVGFAHLFTVLSQLMVGPEFLRNLEEEYMINKLKVESLKSKINQKNEHVRLLKNGKENENGVQIQINGKDNNDHKFINGGKNDDFAFKLSQMAHLSNLENCEMETMKNQLNDLQKELLILEKMKKTPGWKRNLLYPLSFLFVLVFTALTVFMVCINTLQLIVGFKALPQQVQTFSLGLSSMSVLGSWGAALEVVLIFYLMTTSLIGLYNLPGLVKLRPKLSDSSTSHIIYNCGLVLILSSALPVLARILGITNFDLLGNYGKIEWLGNFYIVLLYNIVFTAASTLCLVTKFTSAIRRELFSRLGKGFRFTSSNKNLTSGFKTKED